ncbi:MAG: 50S ribosomal protein L15 [Treponematales bacterium]
MEMQDFDLHAPEGANKKKHIIGRGQGSGRGTTAGKGSKGQKARSGGKTYVGFEGGQMPLYRRLAQRGFSNHPFKKTWEVVNLGDIEKKYAGGEVVDAASLIKKRLVKKAGLIKILGNGELTKKLKFRMKTISAGAREKILKTGGEIVDYVPQADDTGASKGKAKGKMEGQVRSKAGAKTKAAAKKDGSETVADAAGSGAKNEPAAEAAGAKPKAKPKPKTETKSRDED